MSNLNFSYDDERDVLTIEGMKYSGELFRAWAGALDIHRWHKIIKREDGHVALCTLFNNNPNAIEVTQDELAQVFTEWDRRYREEPARFQSEAVRLLKETPETYGQACAPYFVFLIRELRAEQASEIWPKA